MRATTEALLPGRFWPRVKFGEGCWEWQGSRDTFGYGKIKIRGVQRNTHRVAWEMVSGPIPDGLQVLHRCDNPPCVRPDHLFTGTQSDNITDAYRKGRAVSPTYERQRGGEHWTSRHPERRATGERVGGAKLTADDVREIRRLRADGWKLETIGLAFGVRLSNIHQIVTGKTWRHVS